jgi:soluble lytic murein transglycosylase-like protein
MWQMISSSLIAVWIQTANPSISFRRALSYADVIAVESKKYDVDPKLVVSIAWHESGFRSKLVSPTDDYGLLQVHWSPGAPWLKGLAKEDLLSPYTNLKVGIRELAWWRKQHEERCNGEHPYFSHYKWGYKVKNAKYGDSIDKKQLMLAQ